MAETALPDDELWAEFHRVVNMSPQELGDWLRTHSQGEGSSAQGGSPTGQQVLRILRKRRTDLSSVDLQVMRKVVHRVQRGRHGGREAVVGRTGWRHRLMSLGHDPLKPA